MATFTPVATMAMERLLVHCHPTVVACMRFTEGRAEPEAHSYLNSVVVHTEA